jgi:lipopolysaccharide transport system permease protein
MVVFTVVFGRVAKLPSDGVPYSILIFCGLLPWQFFSSALSEASNSLIVNSNLISKIYFPRLVVPVSSVIPCIVDLVISAALMAGLMTWHNVAPGWQIAALPCFFLMAFIAAIGSGLWLSALNVKYRDFRYVIPFIVQFGMFISPVAYSSSIVSDKWRQIFYLNPMAGVIDGFRWSILGGTTHFRLGEFGLSAMVTALLGITGFRYFRKTEKAFADVI